jgi:hypothetical protein
MFNFKGPLLYSNQNSKSKDPMVQFRFFNIHINHKAQLAMINMPLKRLHTGIYKNVQF